MPQLGLTMTEGSVAEWLKKPGDRVQKGEPLFIVSTDKADMEVESLADATVAEIVVEPGRTVPVGTVIAYLEKPGGQTVAAPATGTSVSSATAPRPAQPSPQKAPQQPSGAPQATAAVASVVETRRERAPASPRARRLAAELGVDINKVQGTGEDGRIREADVRQAAETARAASAAPDLRRRQLIAERMVKSIQTIPHFSLGVEINAEPLMALYESLKRGGKGDAGPKITVTDLLLKAMAMALIEAPALNAAWEENRAQQRSGIDLGVAIATERGVVAPTIRHLDTLDLAGISARRMDLIEKARAGRLSLTDLEGGVGTLSNLGMYGVDQFQAIISPGQTFILAVGRIRNRPWVDDSALTVRRTAMLNLSIDHRVADGATAADFMDKITALLENPSRLA